VVPTDAPARLRAPLYGAGGLAGACWSPDSRTLVLAYAAAPQQLVSLHFTADPPSLQAQLLPLVLPEIASRGACMLGVRGWGSDAWVLGRAALMHAIFLHSLCGRGGVLCVHYVRYHTCAWYLAFKALRLPLHAVQNTLQGMPSSWQAFAFISPPCKLAQGPSLALCPPSRPCCPAANGSRAAAAAGGAVVESVAWDPRGQRLAVAVGGKHPAAGCVALYDTRCEPLLSARFIGFVRVGPLADPGAAGGSQAVAQHAQLGAFAGPGAGLPPEIQEIEGEEEREAQGPGRGEAEGSAAARLCFQPGFGQGALLAVRRGDFIGTVPLYFSS
jgi:hypothetical protein